MSASRSTLDAAAVNAAWLALGALAFARTFDPEVEAILICAALILTHMRINKLESKCNK